MILVDWQIKELIDQKLTDQKWKDLVNTASMDVTVGSNGLLLCKNALNPGFIDNVGNQFQKFDLSSGKMMLKPGEKWLVETEQFFRFPDNIAAIGHLKSSRGREFYDHTLAVFISPGFVGKITLEIISHSYNPLPLFQGLKIAQLIFFQTAMPDNPYQGKYKGDSCVSISKDKHES